MFKWMTEYKNASSYTKSFFFQIVLYLIIIMGIYVYAYGRLDFVRPYDSHKNQIEKNGHE